MVRPSVLLALVLAVASCGGGTDYGAFCDAVDESGGTIEEGYFGSDEHVADLGRIEEAIPDDDERLLGALQTFKAFAEEFAPGFRPEPGTWPGEVRVAYDRLTNAAQDECQ